jgi:hypothetical protein
VIASSGTEAVERIDLVHENGTRSTFAYRLSRTEGGAWTVTDTVAPAVSQPQMSEAR